MSEAQTLGLDFVADDALSGFRLTRLEVFNWGTFDGRVWTLQLERHFDFYDWVTPRSRSQETPQPQRPAHSQGV